MAFFTVLGVIAAFILSFVIPKTILCIVFGILFGGGWWVLFIIFAIVAVFFEVVIPLIE